MKRQKMGGGVDKKSLKMWELFGVRLFGSDKYRLLTILEEQTISKSNKIWVATVNPEFLMAAEKDQYFKEILRKTTFNVVDGVGILWAKRIYQYRTVGERLWRGLVAGLEIISGKGREDLIAGADLMDDLCAMAERQNKSVYFFGGWGDRAKKTAEFFVKKYPKLKVVGAKAEDFDFKVKADYLFVARGMKKQEEWIDQNFDSLNVGLVMGVGRSFDYYSGELKRAPEWVRRMGLEWLYSLYREPKRWKRQMELPRFVGKVLKG